ncbi:TPA: hypothetical protein DIU27_02990 [Candidatus Collierbacteria bacterium]|nr:MAG: hypothetical protein UW42_C0037G0004 [Candidatus Collierbacteria bacterium GW2011_GWB1_44_197]HCQ31322.1 hypothetical protein [Candidatus Collierbacteria bacterium]
MKRLWYYYLYILIIWGSFRYFVQLPSVIEELWFKPVIWIIPLFWWQLSMKEKVQMFGKKWTASCLMGLFVGAMYFILIRRFNLTGLKWETNLLGVVLATAVTEELTFSGFVAGYLEKIQKGKWINLLIVGLMVSVIRLPILMFVYKLGVGELLGVFLFSGASGVINAWIRVETGNVSGSVLARMGLNLAVLG